MSTKEEIIKEKVESLTASIPTMKYISTSLSASGNHVQSRISRIENGKKLINSISYRIGHTDIDTIVTTRKEFLVQASGLHSWHSAVHRQDVAHSLYWGVLEGIDFNASLIAEHLDRLIQEVAKASEPYLRDHILVKNQQNKFYRRKCEKVLETTMLNALEAGMKVEDISKILDRVVVRSVMAG